MKKLALVALFAVCLSGVVFAQNMAQLDDRPVFHKEATVLADGTIVPGGAQRIGTKLLDMTATDPRWWGSGFGWSDCCIDYGYLYAVDINNLPDSVVDGFVMGYVTNEVSTDGMTWAVLYYDQATGWGDVNNKVQEAGFLLDPMPNHQFSPPTWFATGWTFTFNLEGSGLEFLMDKGDVNGPPGEGVNDGVEYGLWQLTTNHVGPGGGPDIFGMLLPVPSEGSAGNFGQCSDAFDIYNPDPSTYVGTFWYGGYLPGPGNPPYGGLKWALTGGLDPAANCQYLGIGSLTGNEAGLYVSGDWAVGGNAHFQMRLNLRGEEASLVGSLSTSPKYYSGLDVFRIFKMPIQWRKVMTPDSIGDFAIYDFTTMGPAIANKTVFFQGLITDRFVSGNTSPIDMSLDYIKTN